MIRITWHGPFDLTAHGHAGWAVEGEDIVCAAVSMLLCALAGALEDANIQTNVKLERGSGAITAYPKQSEQTLCSGMFCVARSGLRMLQQQYGAYVQVADENTKRLGDSPPDGRKEEA